MLPGLFYARRQMPLTQRRMTTPAPMKRPPFGGLPHQTGAEAPIRRDYILSFRTLSRRCAVALLSRVPVESSTVTVVWSPVAAR